MDAAHGQQHPPGLYLKVWGLLFVLSTLSYLVDFYHLAGYLRWSLIVALMLLKAGKLIAQEPGARDSQGIVAWTRQKLGSVHQ